jgi:hypothetical protein
MDRPHARRAGLAILRVWVEEEGQPPRARLTTIDDLGQAADATVVWRGAAPDAALEQVRAWLEAWASEDG